MYWELVAYRPVAYKKIVLVVLFFMSYNDILIKLIIKYAIKNTIKYKKLLKRLIFKILFVKVAMKYTYVTWLQEKQHKTDEKNYWLICTCTVKCYMSKMFQKGLFLNRFLNFNMVFAKALMHSIFWLQWLRYSVKIDRCGQIF